jgi:hypothetical protein
LSVARTLLIVIGAVLSILGTYVFALFDFLTYPASGLGFFMNAFVGNTPPFMLPSFISDPVGWSTMMGIDVAIFWVLMIIFLIFLFACFLQLVGLKSRIVGIIFSLFPLGVGVMFLLLFYTDILGMVSASFAMLFIGESIGGFLPIFIDIGDFVGLGAFFLLGGGAVGLVGSILPKD